MQRKTALAEEFFEAASGRGGAVKMKDDAQANRAFAHLAGNVE